MWTSIGVFIAVCVAWQTLKKFGEQKDKEADERNWLQVWEDAPLYEDGCWGTKEIHLPSMLFRYEFQSAGCEPDFALYHVKRTGSGVWERLITSESRELQLAQPEPLFSHQAEARDRLREEGPSWELYEDATIETAYQRFIHAQGVSVFPLDVRWREEEAEHLANARRLQASQREPSPRTEQPPVGVSSFANDKETMQRLIDAGSVPAARVLATQKGLLGTFEDIMCSKKH